MLRTSLFGLVLGLTGLVSALSATGNKLLVIVEGETEQAKYSHLWSDLKERGFSIDYKSPKDTGYSLFRHDEPAYSHLLILPAKIKALSAVLSPNLLVNFINGGSNILAALSSEQGVPSTLTNLLLELDVTLPQEKNSVIVDHWKYDTKSAAEKHDVLLVDVPNAKKAVKNFFGVGGVVAFPRSVGHTLGNASPLLSTIVRAPSTAYSYGTKEDIPAVEEVFATGSQINLVSAFQARNSARLVVLGSAEALEDTWFDASVQLPGSKTAAQKTSNREFAQKLTAWAFKEAGVIKAGKIEHHLKEGGTADAELNPAIYRIKNNVQYAIELSEWDNGQWTPFTPAVGDDVQIEFSMLSPFHRLPLKSSSITSNATVFTAEFKLPDQHGIFNFFVEFRRPFLTNIEEKRTVTVRHFAHDEWPRSFVITGAYPWISGIWITVAGWLAFVAVWLYSKPTAEKTNLKASGAKR